MHILQMFFLIGLILIQTPFFVKAQDLETSPETSENVSENLNEDALKKEGYARKLILLPIAYYTPETKLAAGALMIKNLWKEKEGHTSNVIGTASVTFNKQYMVSLSPRLYFYQGDWELMGSVFYSHFPNRYYGRGVGNSLSSPERYTENNLILNLGGGKNLWRHLFFRGGVAQDLRRIVTHEEGGRIESEIQSLTPNLQVLSAHGGLEWDDRDFPQAPRQGAWYRITQTFFEPKDRESPQSLPRFRKMDLDLRRYFPVASQWLLSGQWITSEVQGDLIPFQYLNSIGGGARMRGFYAGQYRDKALALAQLEVHWERHPKWIPSFFVSTARLGSQLSDLSRAKSFYSGGAGLHYILDPENRTKLRLDFGFTGRETGAYFLLGQAF